MRGMKGETAEKKYVVIFLFKFCFSNSGKWCFCLYRVYKLLIIIMVLTLMALSPRGSALSSFSTPFCLWL